MKIKDIILGLMKEEKVYKRKIGKLYNMRCFIKV